MKDGSTTADGTEAAASNCGAAIAAGDASDESTLGAPRGTQGYPDGEHSTTPTPDTWLEEIMIWPARLAATLTRDELTHVLAGRKWSEKIEVPKAWHFTRTQAEMAELAATAHGMDHNRMHELIGCISSTGERFTLAVAAGNEVAIWDSRRPFTNGSREERALIEMSQSALCESFAYYLLGTGHILASIVMRTLALEEALRPVLLDQLGASCVVNSRQASDWPSLNLATCRKLRRVARSAKLSGLPAIIEPITTLVQSADWAALDEIRGEDYHRRRPQTAQLDGVPMGSAWRPTSDGAGVVFEFGTVRPTAHDMRVAEHSAVMFGVEQLLLRNMPILLERIEAVIQAVSGSEAP